MRISPDGLVAVEKLGIGIFFEPSLTFVLSEEQDLTASIQFAQALYGQDNKYNRIMANKEVPTNNPFLAKTGFFSQI